MKDIHFTKELLLIYNNHMKYFKGKLKKVILLFLIYFSFFIACKEAPEKRYSGYLIKGIEKNNEIKTISDLQEIKIAIGNYLMKETKIPAASNIRELMDILYPRYLSKPIYSDAWQQELIVRSSSSHIEVISKGIDKELGTKDDIKISI